MANDICLQCARPALPHCPQCGSLRRYGFVGRKDSITRPDGHVEHLQVYRCLTCSNVYNDDDWQFNCKAPAQRAGRRPDTSVTKNTVWNPKVPDIEPSAAEALVERLRKRYENGE